MVEHEIQTRPGVQFEVGRIKVLTTEARHTDPDAVGFRFETEQGDFAYTSDTEYFGDIAKYYQGLRLLALCVMRPSGKPWKGHMSTDDAIKILSETRPERAVMTHLGMRMLLQGPKKEAQLIMEKTGVPTVAAVDGMIVRIAETVTVQARKGRGQEDFENFL
jgi:phosphoribosyl 1,2-cyclic phosphodiesterase